MHNVMARWKYLCRLLDALLHVLGLLQRQVELRKQKPNFQEQQPRPLWPRTWIKTAHGAGDFTERLLDSRRSRTM